MKIISRFLLPFLVLTGYNAFAQQKTVNMQYAVSMENAAAHLYHVELTNTTPGNTLDLKMCAWTPGYYQILDFAAAVHDFKVTDSKGTPLKWDKPSKNVWRVYKAKPGAIKVSYNVKAVVPFVGNVYLDETRGYITPGGLFMYLDQELRFSF